MKKSIFTLLATLLSFMVCGQQIIGQWNGILQIQGRQLKVVFHINKVTEGYNALMDSPDQGVKGIPVSNISFKDSLLKLSVTKAGIEYEGVFEKDSIINGNFRQGGQVFPLILTRELRGEKMTSRAQEPSKPYPYHEEEVYFGNSESGDTLAGSLTLPGKSGRFPAAILISGSGPQNRNEEVFGHKPFLVLSDYLTKNGFAVLRYDDRGTGLSTGDFKTATSLEFSTDAIAALNYLKTRKEIDKKKIGLIGHSEGGLIASMVAAGSDEINFVVLLAGPGLQGGKLLLLQQELLGRAAGVSETDLQNIKKINAGAFDIIVQAGSSDNKQLEKDLKVYLEQALKDQPGYYDTTATSREEFINAQISRTTSPWIRYFIQFDPAMVLQKIKCPVLALNGQKDLQVPSRENLSAIEIALQKGENKNITIKELPRLNHLFQECKTGTPDEYATIAETFSPYAMEEILKWLKIHVR